MKKVEVKNLFKKKFNHNPDWIACAPGRVNLLGEHVDYNEGIVLPSAIDRSVYIAGSPTDDRIVTLIASDLNDSSSFSLDQLEKKIDLEGNPLPHWALYPAGVAWVFIKAGLEISGLQAVLTSDIPIGAGLSSSAAVEVGFATLWQAVGCWYLDPLNIAILCQQAENEYVGLSCGLMDLIRESVGI